MADMGLFNNEAFEQVTFTDSIQKIDFQPSLLRDMKIFAPQPSRTTGIMLELDTKTNSLIAVSQRGQPLTEAERRKRNIRTVETHRLAIASTVYASEVQNIRAYGKTSELMQLKDLVADGVERSNGDLALTEENMMLGAVQGIVVDSDGSTILNNWFDFWGVTQPTEVAFDFANATDDEIRRTIKSIQRGVVDAARGLAVTEIVALCGDDFFDDLIGCGAYTGTVQNPIEAQRLTDEYGIAYSTVTFGKITWINYRGSQSESAVSIGTDLVKFFPRAKGLFKQGLGCAEFGPFVNTPGKERYVINIPDRDRDAWMKTELYTYPLFYCTRPEVLFRGKRGA